MTEENKQMHVYTYNANYDDYYQQDIVIIAKDKAEALEKLRAYIISEHIVSGLYWYNDPKTGLMKAELEDLTEQTDDVFETYGVDG
ncbi:MAG: hypothetical protein QXN16_02935 [Candidatus Micrarchaeaceae archaeon]